ncbi:MAG: sulfate adenylyltransferase subunit CysN, partial [Bacilli bacterium]
TQALENAQALESLLIQQGVVAIAKAGLSAEQVTLLRQTGIVVITDAEQGADVVFAQEAVEELAEKIVELVRL